MSRLNFVERRNSNDQLNKYLFTFYSIFLFGTVESFCVSLSGQQTGNFFIGLGLG